MAMKGFVTMAIMNDDYIKEHGYKEYQVLLFDNKSIVARFQKRFDDDYGKKYFIDIIKWSNDYVPFEKRDKWWTPYSYEFEVHVSMHEDEKPINLLFFSNWALEDVEKYMEEFFEKMKPNYYETWDEC